MWVVWLTRARAAEFRAPAEELVGYLGAKPQVYERHLPGVLRVGDPVLDAERNYLGRVQRIEDLETGLHAEWSVDLPPADVYRVLLVMDPGVELPDDPVFRTHQTPRDARWVIQTLLPKAKRDAVLREMQLFLQRHQAKVSGFLRPLAEDVIEHGMGVLERNLSAALESREGEIKALLDHHREMVKEDLVPVIKEQLGPSAKEKAEPILTAIGRELWIELPMWSLSWRAIADWTPGTRGDRVDEWWADFVENTALPIVAEYEDDLIRAMEELVEEAAENEDVRGALAGATRRLADDPRFRALVRGILEDALVRPFELGTLVQQLLADREHQERLAELEQALAPTLQRIGNMLTTGEDGRIDMDLAQVLRRVVFNKDARWVELVEASTSDATRDVVDEAR